MTVVEELYKRHADSFDQTVEPLKYREWIKQTPSGHYVDINLSAQSIRERVVRLLEALSHRESDLEYVYE